MMDFSNKTCCVIEYGIFQSLAHRLARDFGRVFYYRHSRRSHPFASDKEPGMGYDDIILVDSWLEIIDQVDLWVFPDIYDADIQTYLSEECGKRVFGARHADEMEIQRVALRELMKKIGLPVNSYEVVTGMDELRDRLKEVENKYIKSSANIRGTSETWKHIRYNLSEAHLDQLAAKLGARRDSEQFLIDDPIPDVSEVGYDDFCVLGKFAKHALLGVENKDRSYFGKFMPYSALPKDIRNVNEKLAPVLASYDYRCFWSTELRGKYLIDPCPRQASPAGECIQEINLNLSERIWAAAEGEVVEPKPAAKYAAQVIIVSDEVENGSLPIDIPEKNRQWVKLYNSARGENGQEWVAQTPTKMSELGSVVGLGDTPDAAVKACEDHCEGIECMGLEIHLDELEEAKLEVARAA
jgi:hypothetical protein